MKFYQLIFYHVCTSQQVTEHRFTFGVADTFLNSRDMCNQ